MITFLVTITVYGIGGIVYVGYFVTRRWAVIHKVVDAVEGTHKTADYMVVTVQQKEE